MPIQDAYMNSEPPMMTYQQTDTYKHITDLHSIYIPCPLVLPFLPYPPSSTTYYVVSIISTAFSHPTCTTRCLTPAPSPSISNTMALN